jgi:hypothetical protein
MSKMVLTAAHTRTGSSAGAYARRLFRNSTATTMPETTARHSSHTNERSRSRSGVERVCFTTLAGSAPATLKAAFGASVLVVDLATGVAPTS